MNKRKLKKRLVKAGDALQHAAEFGVRIIGKVALLERMHTHTVNELQRACTFIANNVPVKAPEGATAKLAPWGCLLENPVLGSCEPCPAKRWCPSPQKLLFPHEVKPTSPGFPALVPPPPADAQI
jgi:hypothetical protein